MLSLNVHPLKGAPMTHSLIYACSWERDGIGIVESTWSRPHRASRLCIPLCIDQLADYWGFVSPLNEHSIMWTLDIFEKLVSNLLQESLKRGTIFKKFWKRLPKYLISAPLQGPKPLNPWDGMRWGWSIWEYFSKSYENRFLCSKIVDETGCQIFKHVFAVCLFQEQMNLRSDATFQQCNVCMPLSISALLCISQSLSFSLSLSLSIYIFISCIYIYIWLRPFCFSWK